MKKAGIVLLLLVMMMLALPASANEVTDLSIDCEGWSVSFAQFNQFDHDLLITVNGLEVSFEVDPPDGAFQRSGPLPAGLDGSVTLATFWRHRQTQVEGPAITVQLDCTETTTTTTQVTTTTFVEQTTTTVAQCSPGTIHQPPLCVPPTTTIAQTTVPPTTTPPPAELPRTGIPVAVIAAAGLLFLVIGSAMRRET